MADLPIFDDGTEPRKLGNLMPHPTDPTRTKYAWTVYGTVPQAPLVPREQWNDLVLDNDGPTDPNIFYIHDQDGIGQCNCDATTAAAEDTRNIEGLEDVKLSAADLYARINGGADNGSLLEDAIKEMMNNGVGTAATSGLLWHRGMKLASPEERARFKVMEAFLCPTFDHCYSAVLSGFRMISGIAWYDNYNPDSSGWLPRGRGNSGGHAIKGRKATRQGSRYGIWHDNSWGNWGYNKTGAFVIPEDHYTKAIGGWWAIRAMTDEGGSAPILKKG